MTNRHFFAARDFLAALLVLATSPIFVSAQVVINEIAYDLPGSDAGHEWIELYNSGSAEAELTGFKLFESGTNHPLKLIKGGWQLPAGGFAIIADNAAEFLRDHKDFAGLLLDGSFSLSNSGETLALKRSDGTVEDSVTYSSALGANGNGDTLNHGSSGFFAALPSPGAKDHTPKIEWQIVVDALGSDSDASTTSAVGIVGTPAKFEGRSGGVTEVLAPGLDLAWDFGDGATGVGRQSAHAYKLPGEYLVRLKISSGGESVFANLTLKIVAPLVENSLTQASPSLEKPTVRAQSNKTSAGGVSSKILSNGGSVPDKSVLSGDEPSQVEALSLDAVPSSSKGGLWKWFLILALLIIISLLGLFFLPGRHEEVLPDPNSKEDELKAEDFEIIEDE